MVDAIDLLIALVLVVGVSGILWRATRRLTNLARLDNVTVSRQWLMQHRGDD